MPCFFHIVSISLNTYVKCVYIVSISLCTSVMCVRIPSISFDNSVICVHIARLLANTRTKVGRRQPAHWPSLAQVLINRSGVAGAVLQKKRCN